MRFAGRIALALAVVAGAAPAGAQTLRGDGTVVCGERYVVAAGDSLSRIARRAYGDANLYRLLLDANPATLGGNPELIDVDMQLAVPCVDATGKLLTPADVAAAAASIEVVVDVEGPLTAAELETLFGPVALFPDPVLTAVLVAATFPLDVVRAGRFVEGAADLADNDRSAKAAEQQWDDSVRQLAAGFPDLVTRMSDNVDWTEQAGEAVLAQTEDVLAAIQALRAKAKENGYLVSNDAQKVETVDDRIVIAPATSGVVYVPAYDSDVVYTTPATAPPVYHHYGHDDAVYVDDDDWDDALIAGGIILGGAVLLDEIFDDDDWDNLGGDDINWDRGDITIDRDDIDVDIDRGDGINQGDRISIGDRERLRDRDDARVETGLQGGARKGSVSDPASRAFAREKIDGRLKAGTPPASLATPRLGSDRGPAANSQRRPAASPDRVRTPSVQPARPSGARQATRPRPSVSPGRGGGRPAAMRGGGGRGGRRG